MGSSSFVAIPHSESFVQAVQSLDSQEQQTVPSKSGRRQSMSSKMRIQQEKSGHSFLESLNFDFHSKAQTAEGQTANKKYVKTQAFRLICFQVSQCAVAVGRGKKTAGKKCLQGSDSTSPFVYSLCHCVCLTAPPRPTHHVDPRALQVAMTVMIGTLAAIFARGVVYMTIGLTYVRAHAVLEMLTHHGPVAAFFCFLGIALGMVGLSSLLTVYVCQ